MLQTNTAEPKKSDTRANAKPPSAPVSRQSPPLAARSNQAALRLHRKCDCGTPGCDCGMADDKKKKEKDSPRTALHRAAASPYSAEAVPPIVGETLRTPGQSLDPQTRAFFESRFAHDFSGVRVHTDSRAAQSARAVNALAYTAGKHIAFAPHQFSPSTDAGRRLLAHELTHVVQQPSASGTPTRISHPSEPSEREAERAASEVMAPSSNHSGRASTSPGDNTSADRRSAPDASGHAPADSSSTLRRTCGPQIGAPAGCEAGDKTFVDGGVFRFGVNCDDLIDGADAGLLDYAQTIPADSAVEVHGYASVDGPEAFNNNLACARALKGKTWLLAAGVAPSRITRVVNHGPVAGKAADRRSVVVRPAAATPAPKAPGTDTPKADPPKTEPPKDAAPKKETPVPSTTNPPAADASGANPPPSTGSMQKSVQVGMGDVSHYYTTPAGPHDALHEWLFQAMAAYTRQKHGNNQSGEERQLFAQVQYSLTTRQWTVVGGFQEAFVIALPVNLQLSFWGQLTAGSNVSAGAPQVALSVGSQFAWQPKDWFTLGAQVGIGPTVQQGSPNSIDRGALFFLQIQK
jgi:outer membrane protein OmpA-like peptidoglycan-associated protein